MDAIDYYNKYAAKIFEETVEEEVEEEESDSEATGEESREYFPQRRSQVLRSMPDDDEAGTRRGGEDSPLVARKGRSGLVPPGSALVPE